MSIYDAPVSDTEFFPVDGDSMALIREQERIRRRDSHLRQTMAPSKAEHLIKILHMNDENPSSPAKDSAEVPNLIAAIGREITDSSVPADDAGVDVRHHPWWCRPEMCLSSVTRSDYLMHQAQIVTPRADGTDGPRVVLQQIITEDGAQAPSVHIAGIDDDLDEDGIQGLMEALTAAYTRLREVGA